VPAALELKVRRCEKLREVGTFCARYAVPGSKYFGPGASDADLRVVACAVGTCSGAARGPSHMSRAAKSDFICWCGERRALN
jgi:hypothetical protein